MSPREFSSVIETAAESRLWLALSAAQRAWSAAWRDSAAVRNAGRATASLDEWPAADRVRYGAIALATAALGHLGFLALFPEYVAPALPRVAFVGVAILAAVVAAVPQQFVQAWQESALGRLVERINEIESIEHRCSSKALGPFRRNDPL